MSVEVNDVVDDADDGFLLHGAAQRDADVWMAMEESRSYHRLNQQ